MNVLMIILYIFLGISASCFLVNKGVPAPYGCHPSESTRLPDHGWRFPPPPMNYRDSMPFRPPPFEDVIPVANRGM